MDTTETTTTTAGAGTSPGADSGSSTPPVSTAGDERRLTQDEVNAIVAKEKATWKRQQQEAESSAKAKAAEEAAKQAGEWQKLAETTQAERDRLRGEHESLTSRYTALSEVVEQLIKSQLKDLPEPIRALAPSGDDVAARLAWIVQARKAAGELAPPAPRGTPPGPRGTGGTTQAANGIVNDLLAEKRARYGGL